VGNGELAFTVDFSGLQTFLPHESGATPLCTMAQWGFHSYPASVEYSSLSKDLKGKLYRAGERNVAYKTEPKGQEKLFDDLRINPHRLNLARIALEFFPGEEPCRELTPDDPRITDIRQELDVWSGIIDSSFTFDSEEVRVKTACDPERNALAFSIRSRLLGRGTIAPKISFPYGSHLIHAADWTAEKKHKTVVLQRDGVSNLELLRMLDGTRYFVTLCISSPDASIIRTGRHEFVIRSVGDTLEISVEFSPVPIRDHPLTDRPSACAHIFKRSTEHWNEFWSTGGAVDLSESSDLRAEELERRIVLSRYLTAIQCSGSSPPQETGLTCNSWYGKFHLEMHYWHAAHFPLWGKADLLHRSLWWYVSIQKQAERIAQEQGYRGVRWPKMTDISGIDSPSAIGPLLCWQQPHPIMYGELLNRAGFSPEFLQEWASLIFETAEFMTDYLQWDRQKNRWTLGPPVIPAQENHSPLETINPTFELEYWRWGLSTALEWKRRGGLEEPEKWKRALAKLSLCPGNETAHHYLAHERCPETYGKYASDHPSMLCAYGMLPGPSIDKQSMSNTLDEVLKSWNFETCWGWDFPVMALTAARLGRTEDAVDLLLMNTGKNTYRPNGHNAQLPGTKLPLYLPGNGGLLLAVAMMAGGWTGSQGPAPGFPDNGKWRVKQENLLSYI